jgi:glycosyltransferase involved in cell wall biosynthesis
MYFSLVLATKGRVKEVYEFLESLEAQSYKNYEVIIVDQNEEYLLDSIINKYSGKIKIKHIRSEPGLSYSRNIGLSYISGDIVAFPDDDCKYPPNLLEKVYKKFCENKSVFGITGKSVDEKLVENNGKFGEKSKNIDIYSVWDSGISYTIFLKREVIQSVGDFDENLGVGAKTKWQSGEETDYLIRSLKNKFILIYEPDIFVIHPNPEDKYGKNMRSKTYKYGIGMGYVLRKHRYPYWYLFYILSRPALGTLIYLIKGNINRSLHSWSVFRGRLRGMLFNAK